MFESPRPAPAKKCCSADQQSSASKHNDPAKGIAAFDVPRSSGNYQGRSFAFDSKLTKDQVFMEFKEQYPEATIDSDRAFVQVSGEELQVVYATNTEAPDYTLEFVQP